MATWAVAEAPKGSSGISVQIYKSIENARDNFFDRYNQAKTDGQTILNFELEKDGAGLFETNGAMVWMVEATSAEVLV